jgi:hypothetical protein
VLALAGAFMKGLTNDEVSQEKFNNQLEQRFSEIEYFLGLPCSIKFLLVELIINYFRTATIESL